MNGHFRENQPKLPFYQIKNQQSGRIIQGQRRIINNSINPVDPSQLNPIQMNGVKYIPRVIESGYIVGAPIAYTQEPNLPNNFLPFTPNKSIVRQNNLNVTRSISPGNSRIIYQNTPPVHLEQVRTVQQPQIIINSPQIQNTGSNFKPNIGQIHFQQHPNIQIPQSNTIIHHEVIRQQTVPKHVFDKCLNQCKNWQTKYNQLYLKYMNKCSQLNKQSVQELRSQNYNLRQKLRDVENREKQLQHKQHEIQNYVQRYKQSTLKQCYLLFDRYRLECKQSK